MTKVIFEFSGILTTNSPMHVGSGHFRELTNAVSGKDGSNQKPEVLSIVRDACNRPYIPGKTIKGLLRRLVESCFPGDQPTLIDLIGTIKDDTGAGKMGAVRVYGASVTGALPDASCMPFADKKIDPEDQGLLGEGVFIAARTSIDTKSGTADEGKLFHMEMVAPQTRFVISLSVEMRGQLALKKASEIAAKLATALDLLTGNHGFQIGKGQADGFGALWLDPKTVKVIKRSLDATTGALIQQDATKLWLDRSKATPSSNVTVKTIKLRCDAPFIVIDSSVKSNKGQKRPEDDHTPQITAQRVRDNLPMLWGTSVSGALRSRARWLESLRQLREAKGIASPVDPESTIVSNKKDLTMLTPVQRLFGVTGFKGLLTIRRIDVKAATPWDVTSVKIDRFSGAPVDNALFKTAGFINTEVDLEIALEERGSLVFKDDGHEKLFNLIVADLNNGLQLGHGGSKGFGWFKLVGAVQ